MATRENAYWYGEIVSGQTVYGYVGGNPLDYVDPLGLISTRAAAGQIVQELKNTFPGTYGNIDPSITVIPWFRGQGTTVGNWVNINSVAYGFELDCDDLYQLIITVAHEIQHTKQSIGTQMRMRGISDDNYDPKDPHWQIEIRAEEDAAKIFAKMKKICECNKK